MTEKPRTQAQNRRLHSLLSAAGIAEDEKAALVFSFSQARTKSTAELTEAEAAAMIKYIIALAPADVETIRIKKMRSSVLHIISDLGWCNEGGVDYKRLNTFMLNRAVVRKPLKEYTTEELVLLITQLKKMRKVEAAKDGKTKT